jgi:WD40 repeat protein
LYPAQGGTPRVWPVAELPLWHVAFVGDTPQIATCDQDGIIRLIDHRDGQSVATWTNDPKVIDSMAVSPDGQWLAASSGTLGASGEVRLWHVASGELKRIVTDADLGASLVGWESQVAFSPEGTILAIAGDEHTINLWGVTHDKWRGSFGPSVPSEPGRFVMQFAHGGLLLAGVNLFQQVEVKLWNYPGNQAPSADDQ